MGNLKFVAGFLFIVFVGLFVTQNMKKEVEIKREVAEEKVKEKPKIQAHAVPVKEELNIKKFKGQELLLAAGMKYENVPKLEVQKDATGPYSKFPTYKGKLIAEFYNGALHPPESKPQKLLFSPDPEDPDLDAKVAKKFRGYGYDRDKKMQIERGQKFYIVIQGEAVAVQEYTISYNWKGDKETDRYLIKSSNGRIYRRIKDTQVAKN